MMVWSHVLWHAGNQPKLPPHIAVGSSLPGKDRARSSCTFIQAARRHTAAIGPQRTAHQHPAHEQVVHAIDAVTCCWMVSSCCEQSFVDRIPFGVVASIRLASVCNHKQSVRENI
jgi:hypothetical protein